MLCLSLLLILGSFGFRMTAGDLLFATSSGMVMDLMDSMDLDSGYFQLALFAQSVFPNIWKTMRFACTHGWGHSQASDAGRWHVYNWSPRQGAVDPVMTPDFLSQWNKCVIGMSCLWHFWLAVPSEVALVTINLWSQVLIFLCFQLVSIFPFALSRLRKHFGQNIQTIYFIIFYWFHFALSNPSIARIVETVTLSGASQLGWTLQYGA